MTTGLSIYLMIFTYQKFAIYEMPEKVNFSYTLTHMVGCLTEPEQKTFLPKGSSGKYRNILNFLNAK